MESGGAYGAGKAGGPFDPLAFIKKPQVILRLVSWFFSIIVFACISTQGWIEGTCQYNSDGSACRFGTAIGVFSFLGLIALLLVDAMFDNISSIQHRKWAVHADMGFSGGFTFLYFVNFCYLADTWRRSTSPPDGHGVSGVQAAIAFSFFSILSFAGLTYFAVMRFKEGASEAFASNAYDQNDVTQPTPSPYSTYAGGESGDPYQQPPFGGMSDQQRPPSGNFNPPAY